MLEIEYSIFGCGDSMENPIAKGRGVCYANDVPKFLPFLLTAPLTYFFYTIFLMQSYQDSYFVTQRTANVCVSVYKYI